MLGVGRYFPGWHATQCAADSCDCSKPLPYRPAEHATQALLPVIFWYCPVAHELQAAAPAALYFPLGHWLHSVDSSSSVLALCFPTGHCMHCPADASAANLPPSHCSQSAALAPLYLPAGQEPHEFDPAALWYCPAGHASQYVVPSEPCILPASHAAQCMLEFCALPDLPYWPSAHGVHSVRLASLHWPAAH